MSSLLLFLVLLLESVLSQDLEINNATEFASFASDANKGSTYQGKTIYLNADIDLFYEIMSPIGKNGYEFHGHFDGRGHTISGLTIFSQEDNVGLFGCVSSQSSIKNLVLDETCKITPAYVDAVNVLNVGGIIGMIQGGDEEFSIENCVSMANVTFSGNTGTGSGSYVRMGGIVGYMESGISNNHITNCVNKGTISNDRPINQVSIGGIVGYFTSTASGNPSSISRCVNYGTIKNLGTVTALEMGGIVCKGENNFVIEKCVNYGAIISGKATISNSVLIGGVIGRGETSGGGGNPIIIRNCENHGEISDSASTSGSVVGGIVGKFQSSSLLQTCQVYNCVNNGNIVHNGTASGNIHLGGITGHSDNYNAIENCMNFGNISDEGKKDVETQYLYIGGISGTGTSSTTKNCANYGNIEFDGNTLSLNIGGIFGKGNGDSGINTTVENCLNHGNINLKKSSSSFYCGGIVGHADCVEMGNCVGAGNVTHTGQSPKVGGLIGYAVKAVATKCYWEDSFNSPFGSDPNNNFSPSQCYSYSIPNTGEICISEERSLTELLNEPDSSLGYAKWAQNTGKHAVTTIVNGKAFAVQSKHLVLFPSFVESAEDKFSGWYSDNLTSVSTTTTKYMVSEATTMYGVFGTLHKITFKYGNPVASVVSTQAENEALVYPDYTETTKGYSFKWCTDDESVCDPTAVPDSDITLTGTLYANPYMATFKNGYDESETTTKQIKFGEVIEYPSFIRTGYTFNMWESDITVDDGKMPASDVIFIAKWTQNDYTATFKNGYDESGTTTKKFAYGKAIVYPSFSRTGYTFNRWESDVTVDDGKMPASDVTFTARWAPNTYTVTLDPNCDGCAIIEKDVTVTFGSA